MHRLELIILILWQLTLTASHRHNIELETPNRRFFLLDSTLCFRVVFFFFASTSRRRDHWLLEMDKKNGFLTHLTTGGDFNESAWMEGKTLIPLFPRLVCVSTVVCFLRRNEIKPSFIISWLSIKVMNRICYMKMAFSLSSHSSSTSRIQWMTNLRIRRLFGNSWRLWSELRRLCRLYLHSEQQRRETNLSRFFNLCDFDWCCFRRKTLSYDWKSCNPFEARRRREESDLTYLSSSISLITMSVRAEEFVTTQYRWLLGWREERKTSQDSRKSLQQQADISEQSYTVGGLCEIVLHPLLSSLQEREKSK